MTHPSPPPPHHQPRLAFRAPRADVARLEALLAARRESDPFATQSDLLREALAAFVGRPRAPAPPPEAAARG